MYIGYIAARILAAAMLFNRMDNPSHIIYYTFLKLLLCAIGTYGVFVAFCKNEKLWLLIFAATTILFNPIYPFHLSKFTWSRIDIVTAAILVISLFAFREKY
jgi:hypothetical protein